MACNRFGIEEVRPHLESRCTALFVFLHFGILSRPAHSLTLYFFPPDNSGNIEILVDSHWWHTDDKRDSPRTVFHLNVALPGSGSKQDL